MSFLTWADPRVSASWMVRELGVGDHKVIGLAEGEELFASFISGPQSIWP